MPLNNSGLQKLRRNLDNFIAGDGRACQEDGGFAINPWTKVRFENTGMILDNNRAIAMGNYFFTDLNGNEAKWSTPLDTSSSMEL